MIIELNNYMAFLVAILIIKGIIATGKEIHAIIIGSKQMKPLLYSQLVRKKLSLEN